MKKKVVSEVERIAVSKAGISIALEVERGSNYRNRKSKRIKNGADIYRGIIGSNIYLLQF